MITVKMKKRESVQKKDSGYSRKHRWHLVVVFAVPVLIYLQTLTFGFTYFDDNKLILSNSKILSDFGNVARVFQTDAFLRDSGIFYRPLQTLSYMADMHLGGDGTWIYHLSNILLLGFIACFLCLLLRRFNVSAGLALSGTLVYCVHPLFVSSVAWVPARGDLLLMLFSLLSFIFWIDYLRLRKGSYLIYHWLAFTIALFCKETAAVLPLLYVAYFWLMMKDRLPWKKLWFVLLLYALSGITWFVMRTNALGGVFASGETTGGTVTNNVTGLHAIILNIRTIPESFARLFLPWGIEPIPGFTLLRTLAGLIVLSLVIFLAIQNKARLKHEMIFCFAWFLLLLAPTLMFKHEAIDYLDHRFFLPMVGILIFILCLIPKGWLDAGLWKRWLVVAVIGLLSGLTFFNKRSYTDLMTYYTAAIDKNPASAFAYNNRGAAFHNQGFLDDALNDYTKAIEVNPDYASAYNNRGNVFFSKRMYENAISDYSRAIELKWRDPATFNNRGVSYIRMKRKSDACNDFDRAAALGSKAAEVNMERFCNQAPSQ